MRCSTPFGITEYIGAGPTEAVAAADMGAQRLSASRSISGGYRLSPAERDGMCSTPFGITEYIGRSNRHEQRAADAGRVLNAFRHHGVYRALPFVRQVLQPQVLNAFRHHGVYRPARRGHGPPSARSVLNAFRHHGVYRFLKRLTRTWLKCAQRLSASRSISGRHGWAQPDHWRTCSTPFGITEYIGPASQVVLAQERRREFAWT